MRCREVERLPQVTQLRLSDSGLWQSQVQMLPPPGSPLWVLRPCWASPSHPCPLSVLTVWVRSFPRGAESCEGKAGTVLVTSVSLALPSRGLGAGSVSVAPVLCPPLCPAGLLGWEGFLLGLWGLKQECTQPLSKPQAKPPGPRSGPRSCPRAQGCHPGRESCSWVPGPHLLPSFRPGSGWRWKVGP